MSWYEIITVGSRWGAIIFAALTLIHLPKLIGRWAAVREVYGRIPWALARQMFWYTRKSQMAHLVTMTLFGIPIVIGVGARQFLYDDPSELFLFCLAGEALSFVYLADILVPPTVLLLGASVKTNLLSLAALNAALPCYRTVALLRWGERLPFDAVRPFYFNNLRTENAYEWRTIVFHLMDVVPVIVIDGRVDSPAVAEEVARIRRKGYLDRVVFVAEEAGSGPDEPGINRIARADLPAWVLDRAQSPAGRIDRLRRQDEIAAMLAGIPAGARNPQTIQAMVYKSRALEAYAVWRFFRECKGIIYDVKDMRLMEDVPSRVTRAEERKFLRESRALEEVEVLLKSVREFVEQNRDENSAFNIANSINSLGRLARVCGGWDDAIRHIEEAIGHLMPLTRTAHAAEARMELATAHFNLGEVYMARYREGGDPEDRGKAARNFRESRMYDRHAGADTTLTDHRLNSLG